MGKVKAIALAVCLSGWSVTSFAECAADHEGTHCPEAMEPQTSAPAGESAPKGYTWEELVEAIPQLKEYELSFRRSKARGASKKEGTYMVCQKVSAPDSRIKRRACMPLAEYLAYATEQRTAAEQARLEFLSRPSIDPVRTIVRRYN